ncbi:YheC/YheD family protein [Neobacillus mesonae]|uniref:YheC/YheD family endospore coat-associated protein n=1 Tax=Neobacillus mesonae TaxID=1193713 RepID=UPI00203D82B4|nr:YheC/YheD family protein [Neobacillus mesonae]MCM3567914.1 YheC/YheD family protein [Neobacillus mesonae]
MPTTITPVTVSSRKPANEHDRLIQMSSALIKQLNLSERKTIYISLGKTIAILNIQAIDKSGNEIILPENVLESFRLPIQTYKFQAHYLSETNTLKLGPVIALLTNFSFKENEEPNFRSVHKFCEELDQVIKGNSGFFYVFSFDQFLAKGYYLHDEKWIPGELPIPDVIYNRIHSRKLEQTNGFIQFRKDLELFLIPLFNDRFLSKWEVYEQIHHEKSILSSIPETQIFSKENLYDLAQKYETVFIKPIHGSQGRNIIKLCREKDNRYMFQSSLQTGQELSQTEFPLEEIYEHLKPILQNRIYIVQQGISFLTKDLRPMDFRVLCHKSSPNQWGITSIVARIGAEQEFVSNLARGGTIMRPLEALSESMGIKKAKKTISKIKELALEIASSISSSTQGIIGELGIDIGVDIKGKPWLIEVNSKPSKSFEENEGKIRPSAKAIIQFCTTLVFEIASGKEGLNK